MATGVFSRMRSRGIGFPDKQVTLGTMRTTSKISGYTTTQIINGITRAGQRIVTRDNVNPAYMGSRKRGKNSSFLRKNYDCGGDFSMYGTYDWSNVQGRGIYTGQGDYTIDSYDGGWLPIWPDYDVSNASLAGTGITGKFSGEFGTASEQGPAAWKKFKPKLYVADMGQFFGEIRETLPMLQQTARIFSEQFLSAFGTSFRHAKSMSKEMSGQWLNLQFGYVPFVSDLVKCLHKAGSLNTKLAQCKRDNGQWVRRSGVVGSTEENPTTVRTIIDTGLSGETPLINPRNFFTGGTMWNWGSRYGKDIRAYYTYTEKYRTWFVGCFRYFVPSFDYPEEGIESVLNFTRMFGIRITPTLIWNLTPWSWLADWVGNIGDNIDNFSTSWDANMAAKYAYIMKTMSGEATIQATLRCGAPIKEVSGLSWSRGFVVKTRRHANQFGFTLDWPSFSQYQWSILAALGMSRFHIEAPRG